VKKEKRMKKYFAGLFCEIFARGGNFVKNFKKI
jgi:hypothetical protein